MAPHFEGGLLSFLSLLEKNIVRVTEQQLPGIRAQKPHRVYPRTGF